MIKHAYPLYILIALALTAAARVAVWNFTSLDPLWTMIAAINIATFALMGWDKTIAPTELVRVPEAVFWGLGLCGGSAGLLLAMKIFRHTTKDSHLKFFVVAIIAILSQVGAQLR